VKIKDFFKPSISKIILTVILGAVTYWATLNLVGCAFSGLPYVRCHYVIPIILWSLAPFWYSGVSFIII
jgi:hypothetical protein